MGAGGGSQTTRQTPVYTEPQIGAQGELMNQLRTGIGTAWRAPGEPATGSGARDVFAPSDWMRQTGNQMYGQLGQQFTGGASGIGPWMQGVNSAIAENPAANAGAINMFQPNAWNSGDYMGGYTGSAVNAAPMGQYTGQAVGYSGPGSMPSGVSRVSPGFSGPTESIGPAGGGVAPSGMPPGLSRVSGGGGGGGAPGSPVGGAGGVGGVGGYVPTLEGVQAYDPQAALGAAQNYMNRVVAPQIAQNMVAGGQGGASGAMLEALANAGSGMALPLTQQVMGNQASWYNPQLQGSIQGALGQQAAQNQMLYGTQQAGQQGLLNQQQAQNQMGLGTQNAAQNALLQAQGAQNQFMGAGQQAGLQGLLNQGQNMFGAQMAIPGMQGQFLNNIINAGNAQMGVTDMDRQGALNAYLNQQQQFNNMMANLGALGSGTPAMNSTTTQGGGGFNFGRAGTGAMGGALTGAMLGSVVPGIGTGIGALGGGLMGLLGGF